MNNILTPIFACCAAIGLATSPAVAQDEESAADGLTEGEAELAKLLEGRVAGEPQSCIRTFPSRNLTVIDETAIVYDAGRTVYVNRTQHPQSLDEDDALLIRKFGSATRLCRLDTITTFDRLSGFYSGNVFLTDFIPYEKPEATD